MSRRLRQGNETFQNELPFASYKSQGNYLPPISSLAIFKLFRIVGILIHFEQRLIVIVKSMLLRI